MDLVWEDKRIVAHAIGEQSEFVVILNGGRHDLIQRVQVGPKTRRKFIVLRQEQNLSLETAKKTAQIWETLPLPQIGLKK